MKKLNLLKCGLFFLFCIFHTINAFGNGVENYKSNYKDNFLYDIYSIPYEFKKSADAFIDNLNSGEIYKMGALMYPNMISEKAIMHYTSEHTNISKSLYPELHGDGAFVIHNVILIDNNVCFLVYWSGKTLHAQTAIVALWVLDHKKWRLVGYPWDFRTATIVSYKYIKNKPNAWVK